jgi:RNA polymerase-associated protein LEO1
LSTQNYLLKIPQFVSIEPAAFDIQSFQPPTTDHHSNAAPSTGFSAHKTAQTTVRWRHSPSNPSELQSNARFLRWSDGSLTLQLASDPTVQYEVASKALAPRQRNAPKPTPVSINDGKRGRDTWNEKSESWTYLASASNASFMIRVTNKITASLQVMPSNDSTADEALERLQISMAASRAREGHVMKMGAVAEDPELAKKKAEQAEREKQRAMRRLEAQQIREKERASRVVGRAGGPRSGLTVGGLEDDDIGARGSARAPRPKQRRRPRNDEYSDDEEEYFGRRRGREDDYDEEDDFIAASDEEEDRDAEGSEEEDFDAILESRDKELANKSARAGTPKRDRPRDVDADVEHDSPVSRQKRRRVVEEDDDDE